MGSCAWRQAQVEGVMLKVVTESMVTKGNIVLGHKVTYSGIKGSLIMLGCLAGTSQGMRFRVQHVLVQADNVGV
jgi:hypothetical protein